MGELVLIQKNELQTLIQEAVLSALNIAKADKYATQTKLTVQEAADFTGLKISNLRKKIQTGKLKIEDKNGTKTVYILKKDLLPFKK